MSRQIIVPNGAEQWLINLIDLKNRTDISLKQIAEKENVSEKSVSNVFFGKSKNPGVDLIRRIIHALGGSWSEIFGESGAVIGGQDLASLQKELDSAQNTIRDLTAEVARLTEENTDLRNQVLALTAEVSTRKDEIISLYREIVSLQKGENHCTTTSKTT